MTVHRSQRRVPARSRGFSLIELLVALAVVGLLAAVALPAYLEQVARARRADVQAALMEDAAYMAHYYAVHDAYADTPAPVLPLAQTPRLGSAAYLVKVQVPANDPTSFVLVATRAGAMAADACGDFSLDSLGQRDLVAGTAAPGRDAASCWR